jgi:hypothetical protein
MRKIWFGLAFAAFAAINAEPAPAQNRQNNFVECTKELGLQLDPNAQRLQDGRTLRTWYAHTESNRCQGILGLHALPPAAKAAGSN